MKSSDFVTALRNAAPYAHAHHGSVFVIAFGGEVCARPDFERFLYDLALLHSLGVKLVLVHGARSQIDAALKRQGIKPQFHKGQRITSRPALEAVKSAVGSLRMSIEAQLSTSVTSSPMGGARLKIATGNWVTARPVGIRDGVDHQYTGAVRRIDVDTLRANVEADRIALLSPIGYSPTGEIFNLRYEEVATATAAALNADKLIFVLPSDPNEWKLADSTGDAGQVSLAEAEQLLKKAKLSEQDQNHLLTALDAARGGVSRVHLIGAAEDGGLLRELYTRDGAGLMLYSDANYEATRDATIEDVGGVMALIRPLEDEGVLVPRSREQLELDITQFNVIVRDGLVIACCALLPYADEKTGELACVAVHPDYQRAGRAAALLKRVEMEARKLGLKKIFSLTTHSPHWFIEHGFRKGTVADLPAERQKLYNWQRKSIVLVKKL